MEMSIREAKAKFSAAIAAAERGETVTITKHGKVIARDQPATGKKIEVEFRRRRCLSEKRRFQSRWP